MSATLAPGEGGLVEFQGRTVAGYRGEDGTLHAVSATCTHLGPCHGSRFEDWLSPTSS